MRKRTSTSDRRRSRRTFFDSLWDFSTTFRRRRDLLF